MAHYNYHAKIKRLLNEGAYLWHYYTDWYKKIPNAMVIYMVTGEKFPIREHKHEEYKQLINNLKQYNYGRN